MLGEASTKWYRSQAYYDSAAWRGTWALDGGSLMNQGIHYVDLLLWAMASHAAQIADLLGAIDAGRQPSVTAESGRAALEVVCAVYQSAREGRKIVLPTAAGAARSGAGMH